MTADRPKRSYYRYLQAWVHMLGLMFLLGSLRALSEFQPDGLRYVEFPDFLWGITYGLTIALVAITVGLSARRRVLEWTSVRKESQQPHSAGRSLAHTTQRGDVGAATATGLLLGAALALVVHLGAVEIAAHMQNALR